MSSSAKPSAEAILAVLAGLAIAGCGKKSAGDAKPEQPPITPAIGGSAAPAVTTAPPAAPAVSAKEVPSAAGSAEKAGACAPGGCAPGACGGSKK